MSNGISATGFFTSMTGIFANSENEITTLSQQLNSGKKSTSLQEIGRAHV